MNSSHPNGWTPSPELLAAFADGELDQRNALRRNIEDWLAAHPDAANELEAQLELTRLLGATTPAEPSPHTWADMWARINNSPARHYKRWPAAILIAGLAAAAVAIMVLPLASNLRPTSNSHQPPPPVAQSNVQQPPV
ncbi:MAG TPA: hypothetical protein VE988_19180, partial [Gemmataceae bacterium]|nr:hypothetical protein [Gemmataceae bacterium]